MFSLSLYFLVVRVLCTQSNQLKRIAFVMIGIGLLLATATGLGSWLFGYPFLTSTFSHVHWPLVGDFELASAMLFDLGVFMVVVGVTLVILLRLGRLHDFNRPDNAAEGED